MRCFHIVVRPFFLPFLVFIIAKFKPSCFFCGEKHLLMNDLYWFNPDNEMSVANGGASYTLPGNIAAMADDLSFLPACLAADGDFVLVPEPVDAFFLDRFRDLFRKDVRPVLRADLSTLAFGRVLPWGWSPRAHRVLAPAVANASPAFRRSPAAVWDDTCRDLRSRVRALDCLRLLRGRLDMPCLADLPAVCESLEEVRRLAAVRPVVVKAPWSSSGRGVLMLRCGPLSAKEEQIVGGVLRRQGFVMVEPRLRRLLDFAMEFELSSAGAAECLGLSVFFTGDGGGYEGNLVAAQPLLRARLAAILPDVSLLDGVRGALTEVLPLLFKGKYEGPLGVDMMVYEDSDGRPLVQPCVEINLRHTMGLLALRLAASLAPGGEGLFRVRYSREPGVLARLAAERRTAAPLRVENGLLRSGCLALTPVGEDTRFAAELFVVHEQ